MSIFKKQYLVVGLLCCALVVSGCQSMATSAIGILGKAAGDERSIGEMVDDSTIKAEITHYFVQSDVNDLLMNVTIRVHEGRVMLTGRVKKTATAHEAVRLSWIARGVAEVINNIEVAEKDPIIDDAGDSWIEAQIEARLLATKNIRSLNYTVEVENSVVYLLGLAQSEDEMKNVANIASLTKGVKRVVSYVRLKTDPESMKR